MANEFKVKKGLVVDGSGTVVDIQGTAGQLFSVTDSLTGDLFSVSDVSGVPILNVNSSGTVKVDGVLNVNSSSTLVIDGTVDSNIVMPTAGDQIRIGTFTDGSNNSGEYANDDIVIGDGGSISIFPHRRGDYGLNETGNTSTTFRSKLNIWSDNQDHITFGGAHTKIRTAWEHFHLWINNDSTDAGLFRLYNKSSETEFARLAGEGSSFVLQNFRVKQTNDTTFTSGLTVERSANTQKVHIGMDGGAVNFNSPNGLSYKFRNNTVEKFTISGGGAATASDKITVNKESQHVAQNAGNSNNAHIDLYNTWESNTDQKGSILTFTDNYYDGSSYIKTLRAMIKGGTDSVGNNGAGYLEFYTNHTSANTPRLALRLDKDKNAVFGGTIDASGRVLVSGNDTDQYFFEGKRTGSTNAVTYRLYNNADNIYHDSYTSQVVRVNQIGGSGGSFGVFGGYVGMGVAATGNQRLTLAEADANGSHLKMNNSRSGGGFWVNGVGDSGSSSSIVPAGGLFWYNGATRMVINSSGNLGVGIVSPSNKLHVVEGTSTWETAEFQSSSTTGCGITLVGANISGLQWSMIANASSGGAGANNLGFHLTGVGNSGGSTGYKMTIKASSGHVGISTVDPRYQLDLAKVNNASQTDYLALGVNNGPSTGDGTSLGTGIVWKANYSGYSKRSAGIMQTAEGNYFRSGLAFFTNNATSTSSDWVERMRLNMDGKLTLDPGAGVATDGTVLDVQGSEGQLFSVTNSLTGDLFSVADVSGIPIFNVNSSGLSTFDGDVTLEGDITINGGDITIAKQNDAPTMTLLHDGTNPSTNDLLFRMQFQSDYNGSHQNWGKIELDTNASAVRTNMDFYVKSASGNEQLALSLEGQPSATPNAIFAGNILLTGGGTIEAPSSSGNESLTFKAAGGVDFLIDSNGNSGDDQNFRIMKHSINSSSELFKVNEGGDVTISANLHSVGQNLKFHAAGTHVMNIDINGKVYPNTHNAYDIGHSTSLAWRDAYFSGTVRANAFVGDGSNLTNLPAGSAPSNMVTTNTTQTISAAKTFSSTVNFNNTGSYNARFGFSAGTQGSQIESPSTGLQTFRCDSDKLRFWMGGTGGSSETLTIDQQGRIGIKKASPAYTLDVNGNVSNISIYASHDVAAYSDARVKTDVETIPNALDKVNKLRGVTFKRTDEGSSDKRMMGVIAQEVLDVIPEVVNKRESDGHYSVSYGNIVGVLIEAVKELTAEVEELKKQIK